MQKIQPGRIITDFVNKAFIMVDFPKSNNPRTQQMLSDLMIANAMASMGTAKKKVITDELKDIHLEKLKKAVPNEAIELEKAAPFTLTAKVGNPRSQFDKDAFIKAVADEYDLSVTDLIAMAKKHNKLTAAPVSFEVTVDNAL